MPELPEVEVTRRGIEPHLVGKVISGVAVRNPRLRWKIPADLGLDVQGATIRGVARRGKYLLLDCGRGTLILHLGMSGSLRLLPASTPAAQHDHFDLLLGSGEALRLRDPRRFGAVLWTRGEALSHPLLADLGPEPLDPGFGGEWLYRETRRRRAAIKQVLMDSRVVAGVGNIYANEALFHAGIRPSASARRISLTRYEKLAAALAKTLKLAISAGGSSLRDFVDSEGNPGYFQQHYFVYDRAGRPCRVCGTPIQAIRQGSRASFYCPRCQK